jgi:hypothetical protein
VAITDELNALRTQPQQKPSWVQDLITRVYKPEDEQFQHRQPVGFDFKRDPLDSTTYYNQLKGYESISNAASGVVAQEVANKRNSEQQRLLDEQRKALEGVNPNFTYETTGKSRKYGLKGVTSNTAKAADYWGSKYGISTIGGYREHGSVPGSDHPKGRALDYMINNIKNGKAVGTALANDVIKNAKAWNVSYVIWNRYIWSPSKGWRKYNGPSPHTDHVHVSFNS